MKVIAINLFKLGLNFIFVFMKLINPQKDQIIYLSRQYDTASRDAVLLSEEIRRRHPEFRQVFRFRMMAPGLGGKLRYALGMLGDMYHLAGSKVAICDTYSISISCLKQRPGLKVVQIWHAMGAIKKFGWQSLGMADGRDATTSRAMNMHEGYDYILAPSEATGAFYQEGFHQPHSKIRLYTLPHMDDIMDGNSSRDKLQKLYPELGDRKLVVYVPTFRETEEDIVPKLQETFRRRQEEGGLPDWYLLISLHPLSKLDNAADYAIRGNLSSAELMKAADAIITDYSACAFEAACLSRELYFYVPDLEWYRDSRGLNVDLEQELPEMVYQNADGIWDSMDTKKYDYQKLQQFAAKYVSNTSECTAKLAAFITELM